MNYFRYPKFVFPILCLLSLFLLCGCVSIDPRTSSEKIDIEATATLKGGFENKSEYQSQSLDIYSKNISLAELLGLDNAKNATDIEIALEAKRILHAQFLTDGKVLLSKEFVIGTDFKIDSDGKIEIWQKHGCGLDPGAGLGCERQSVTLFVNVAGDLICNVFRSGAGLAFLVIPAGGYTKEMTIHHKLIR